jgi:hypothetical protein
MGIRTDFEIAAQKNAGLNLPSPTIQQLWGELQRIAFEAIKAAELVKSDIRDDGCFDAEAAQTLIDLRDVISRLLGDDVA